MIKRFLIMLIGWIILNMVLGSVQSLVAQTSNDRQAFIEKSVRGKQVLLQALAKQMEPHVYHIFTHGRPGELLINGQWLTAKKLVAFFSRNDFLSGKTHLNIYACNFAKGKKGKQAVLRLERTLGVSVAASDDITGSGGDWELEIGTPIAVLHPLFYEYNLQELTCSGGSASRYDVSIATYPGASEEFYVGAQESFSQDLAFSSNGLKMFVVGGNGDAVVEYHLSIAWDVSTATYAGASEEFSINAQETFAKGMAFSADGSKMFIVGVIDDAVVEYHLSTAWDVSTATHTGASEEFSVNAQESTPSGLAFSSNGLKMFVVGSYGDAVVEYHLSIAWDVSTATYAGASEEFSVSDQEVYPTGLTFSSDGTKMFVVGSNGDAVVEYHLSIAWDVSTATYPGASEEFSVFDQESSAQGLAFSSDGSKLYVLGYIEDVVVEYNITSSDYHEVIMDDGSLLSNGSPIFYSTTGGATFKDTNANDTLDGGVNISNLPAGLTASWILNVQDTMATLVLTGSATSHTNTDDVASLDISFGDGAFTAGTVPPTNNCLGMHAGINFREDTDQDEVFNSEDIDDDNDGIPDVNEDADLDMDNDPTTNPTDTDGDGIADHLDKDADNDGILDNHEAQSTFTFTALSGSDTDGDGLDNAYDTDNGGMVITLSNWDATENADYLDIDSDGDGTGDWQEAITPDTNGSILAEMLARATVFEIAANAPGYYDNSLDTDADGIPDWLEDSDGDGYPNFLDHESSFYKDSNGDGLADLYDTSTNGAAVSLPNSSSLDSPDDYDFRDDDLTNFSLPIELVSFSAKALENQAVQLTWQTATEINNDFFTIERSRRGIMWENLQTIDGAGNSSYPQEYSWLDENPYFGVSYYRLKQTDFDGTQETFDIEVVSIHENQAGAGIYPNPNNGSELYLSSFGKVNQLLTVRLLTMEGKMLQSKTLLVTSETTNLIWHELNVAHGVYLVHLEGAYLNMRTLLVVN